MKLAAEDCGGGQRERRDDLGTCVQRYEALLKDTIINSLSFRWRGPGFLSLCLCSQTINPKSKQEKLIQQPSVPHYHY